MALPAYDFADSVCRFRRSQPSSPATSNHERSARTARRSSANSRPAQFPRRHLPAPVEQQPPAQPVRNNSVNDLAPTNLRHQAKLLLHRPCLPMPRASDDLNPIASHGASHVVCRDAYRPKTEDPALSQRRPPTEGSRQWTTVVLRPRRFQISVRAATSWSMSTSVCSGDGKNRMRSVPRGTTG